MARQYGVRGYHMNKDNEYIQIDLMKIAQGLIKRFWIILISMILCGALMFSIATFYITPMYESSVLMYVNNSSFAVGSTSFSISSSEISAAKSLVDTYMVILKTRLTINDVIRLGGLDYSYEDLCRMIEAGSVNETEVFSVTVTSPDPHEAEHIANTIARVLPDKIASVVEGSSVRIVDYAVVPSEKVSPSITKFTAVGFVLGTLISLIVLVIIALLDNTVHDEEYIINNYNYPVLAKIPDLLDSGAKKYSYYNSYKGSK